MPRQLTPKLAALASLLFFFLVCSETILAQNPAGGAFAARDPMRVRGQRTSQRQTPPPAIASVEKRSTFLLPPIVIYYPRRDAPPVAEKLPNPVPEKLPNTEKRTARLPDTEKQTIDIGKPITIYYRTYKSDVSPPARKAGEPKPDQTASRIVKSPPTKPQSYAATPAARAVGSITTSVAAAPPPAPKSEPPPVAPPETLVESKAADPTPHVENPAAVDTSSAKINVDPKPPVEKPAAVEEPSPAITADPKPPVEKPAAVDASLAATHADPKPPVANPTVTAELTTAIEADPKPSVEKPATIAESRGAETVHDESSKVEVKEDSAPAEPPTGSAGSELPVATESEAKPVSPRDTVSSGDAINLNNRAVQLTSESRYDEASDLLRRAIQAEPGKYKFHRNLSIIYEQMNKLSESRESAQIAVKLAPREPTAVLQLCNVELQLKLYGEAVGCYEKLSTLTSLDTIAQTHYGVALTGSGRTRDALDVLEKVATALPARSTTYNALGMAYYDQKRYPEAISAFKSAVEIDPGQHEQRFNLGIAYLAISNREGALSQYRVLKQENTKLAEKLYQILFSDYVISVDQLRQTQR